MNTRIYFDIETEALPLEQLRDRMPAFDPEQVKVGNIKDPDKIKEKIEQAKANHERDYLDKAALSATTGRVLIVGMLSEGKFRYLTGTETEVLEQFWPMVADYGNTWIGHNCFKFDWPFLIRRAWVNGVKVFHPTNERGYYLERMKDTMAMWCGSDRQDRISLDTLARVLGVGKKSGNGKQFSELWHNPETREQAIAYLRNDLELTRLCHEKML